MSTPTEERNKVLDLMLRLHTDAEFFEVVKMISELDSEALKVLQQHMDGLGKK